MTRWTATLLMIAAAIVLSVLPIAHAVDIKLSDACSLAAAIQAANTNTPVGDCPAGDGPDTIHLSGDITLDATLPTIIDTLTIEGGGFTISGDQTYRIFIVIGGPLTVHDLVMTMGIADEIDVGGKTDIAGGAIVNLGKVIITGSTFSDNLADNGGAIYSRGSELRITDSTFTDNYAYLQGGAIRNVRGHLTITNSTFTGNQSAEEQGGAIDNGDELTITGSTFTENVGGSGGGAIHNCCEYDKLSITNSVFTGNVADGVGGAISNILGELSIKDSVFTRNSAYYGGAIHNYKSEGEVPITNSTFADNQAWRGGAINNTQSELKHCE